MNRPNLFQFATSELSQDAWLCWLVAHLNCDERPLLREAARDFVARLWKGARADDQIAPSDVGRLRQEHPVRQHERIDVLFEVAIRGVPAIFIVEDKTGSSHHSGQLARYLEIATKSSGNAPVVVVPIYFKTGYQYEHDARARDHGYHVVSLDDLVAFLETHRSSVQSDIFEDYAQIQIRNRTRRDAALSVLDDIAGHADLGSAFVQHAFLARLRDRARVPGDSLVLNRGTSIGGAPWTHWAFATVKDRLPGDLCESLFHRVDARQDAGERRFYLSTRQYARVKGRPEAQREKVKRLRVHRQIFQDACAGSPLRFSKVSGDHAGANESEVGVLFFSEDQTTAAVLQHFPLVHRRFVALLDDVSHRSDQSAR